jgi:hypothetical protein
MRLYRFLSAEFALKSLKERQIKISEIHDLNDPYELIPFDLSDPEKRSILEKTRDELNPSRGLVCFSAEYSNPVLWAHYAEKHRGLCLGFDVPEEYAVRVKYITEPLRLPEIHEAINGDEAVQSHMTTRQMTMS